MYFIMTCFDPFCGSSLDVNWKDEICRYCDLEQGSSTDVGASFVQRVDCCVELPVHAVRSLKCTVADQKCQKQGHPIDPQRH